MWSPDQLLALARRGLEAAERRAVEAQDVHGLDARREVELHPVLAEGFRAGGLGVLREQPYPGEVQRRAKRPSRDRCDLVLLPRPSLRLADPVSYLIESDRDAATLFAGIAPPPDPTRVGPEDAYWLEVKAVGQFTYTDGVPGENRAYGTELVRGLCDDLAKLAQEAFIHAGGVLLIHFTRTDDVAAHDLDAAMHRVLDRGLPVRSPRREMFTISDRIGNAGCSVALLEIAAAR